MSATANLDLETTQVATRDQHAPTAAWRVSFFLLAILGFSFWFFLAVPFASHRESYSWYPGVETKSFAAAFGFISVTYRPLGQGLAWLGFRLLHPSTFPTSPVRQTLLQLFVYATFAMAWWFIVSAAKHLRLLALISLVAGGVFFPGYVHLFHIYGMFYSPVILMIGALLVFYSNRAIDRRERWLAVAAVLLVLWHPFATALFAAFYFGFYLETFRQRRRQQHLEAVVILAARAAAVILMADVFARSDVHVPLATKLYGGLVSYRTSEVNAVASLVAFILAQFTLQSIGLRAKVRWSAAAALSVLAVIFYMNGLAVLLLWLGVVLIKLVRLRDWCLFFLLLGAALLPIGAIIGSPVFGLFAIVIAVYATALGWPEAERALAFLRPWHALGIAAIATAMILLMRSGIRVPVVAKAATPLLSERERTFQLEHEIEWLHRSKYCSDEIAFADNGGSPIDSVENVLRRRYRPPSDIDDVRQFWDSVMRCNTSEEPGDHTGTVILTFGDEELHGEVPVFTVKGKYAGDSAIWVSESQLPSGAAHGEE